MQSYLSQYKESAALKSTRKRMGTKTANREDTDRSIDFINSRKTLTASREGVDRSLDFVNTGKTITESKESTDVDALFMGAMTRSKENAD